MLVVNINFFFNYLFRFMKAFLRVNFFWFFIDCLPIISLVFIFILINYIDIFTCFSISSFLNVYTLNFDLTVQAVTPLIDRISANATLIADHYCQIINSWDLDWYSKMSPENYHFVLLVNGLIKNWVTDDEFMTLFNHLGRFQIVFEQEFKVYTFMRTVYDFAHWIAWVDQGHIAYNFKFEAFDLLPLKELLLSEHCTIHPKVALIQMHPAYLPFYRQLNLLIHWDSLFQASWRGQTYCFYVALFELLYSQLFFIEMATFFIKKKIFIFFLCNLFLIFLMFWNLIWLCNAINLIYALIHFLAFAVLSGLLIILWGATYIGFCVLLIYAAAIPVLALYIIMLVNVDLIQRLFFIEHLSYNSWKSKLKRILFLALFLLFILFSVKHLDFTLATKTSTLADEIYQSLFYLLLTKWYINSLSFSYATGDIFDLVTTFYFSDIDKVASAAFKTSSNELLALVLLLLIAIIIVISISWTGLTVDNFFYQSSEIDLTILRWALSSWNTFFLWRLCWIALADLFLETKEPFFAWGVRGNFIHNPMFLYIHWLDVLDAKPEDWFDLQRLLLEPATILNPYDPWMYWYLWYETESIYDELKADPLVIRIIPYGPQNKTQDDEALEIALWGILN